jgi:hypothetical protein
MTSSPSDSTLLEAILTSSELASLSKRSGVTTRRRAQAVTQLEDVNDDELPPVEELLKSEG